MDAVCRARARRIRSRRPFRGVLSHARSVLRAVKDMSSLSSQVSPSVKQVSSRPRPVLRAVSGELLLLSGVLRALHRVLAALDAMWRVLNTVPRRIGAGPGTLTAVFPLLRPVP